MTTEVEEATPEETFTVPQIQRIKALEIAAKVFTARPAMFGGNEATRRSVLDLTSLADWILTGDTFPARDSEDELIVTADRLQQSYNNGWNDLREQMLTRSGRQGSEGGNEVVAIDWSEEHPAEFDKPDRVSDDDAQSFD